MYKTYLVYIIEIPLILPQNYELYKISPLPIEKSENVHVYIDSQCDYIFTDQLR